MPSHHAASRAATAFSLGTLLLVLFATPALARERCWLGADLDGVVHQAAADHLERAVRAAEQGPCEGVLVVVDTPGGGLEATRSIVKTFLGAKVPVVGFVHPAGARAGSAGLFIVAATHVAAMAPGTNIGAAHPVTRTGKDPEEAGGEELARKIEKDTAAFARAIAQRRDRNADWLEKAVVESASATAKEALELDVVDIVVSSTTELMRELDGRRVSVHGRETVFETAGATIESFPQTIRERVLSVLGNPDLAYLLLMVGMLGVLIELYNPGTFIAGGVGVFALLLAAIGMNMLPVHLGAVLLMAAAAALFIAELYVTSFGLLAAGGLVALLLGSALLIDQADAEFFAEPSVRVSWGLVIPLAVVFAGLVVALSWRAAKLLRVRPATGSEALIDMVGKTLTPIDGGSGWVRVHGERWQATARQEIPEGTDVRVVSRNGLTLEVEPCEARASGKDAGKR